MNKLPIVDLCIIGLYLIAMIGVGFWFSFKNQRADQFTKASGNIPSWAIGLSIYATFLSSNTFLGVPGKAFGSNWNAFVFSLSMPVAAFFASRFFVSFYRHSGEVSAYTHLEKRFGPWARTYAVTCFLLTQLARIGSVFFGVALSLQALTGYSMELIMTVTGICIIIYTVLGGIEAVIWTEVVQGVIKTFGAVLILYLLIDRIDGGFETINWVGVSEKKISLGSFDFDFNHSTFWVIFLYGVFINLNNFGMDQNYVQRYHAAKSPKDAARSIWLCVWIYVPTSLLFFLIGTSLYVYYQANPALIEPVKLQAAAERLGSGATAAEISRLAATLQPADYGDKVMPHFMVTQIPTGLIGIIISAILSAAMSTISSGMNASATVFVEDIYKRYFKTPTNERATLRALHIATVVVGLCGMSAGIAMIGISSVLDLWWVLSGIFAGGMLGLFLLGLVSKYARNADAAIATAVGIIIIIWMTFSEYLPQDMESLKSPLDKNMIIVVGTLSIFLIGSLLSRLRSFSRKNI